MAQIIIGHSVSGCFGTSLAPYKGYVRADGPEVILARIH